MCNKQPNNTVKVSQMFSNFLNLSQQLVQVKLKFPWKRSLNGCIHALGVTIAPLIGHLANSVISTFQKRATLLLLFSIGLSHYHWRYLSSFEKESRSIADQMGGGNKARFQPKLHWSLTTWSSQAMLWSFVVVLSKCSPPIWEKFSQKCNLCSDPPDPACFQECEFAFEMIIPSSLYHGGGQLNAATSTTNCDELNSVQ